MTQSLSFESGASIVLRGPSLSEHPWVYKQHLEIDKSIKSGSIVNLISGQGSFLAKGFINNHARVGFRVLTKSQNTTIDAGFFKTKLREALALRELLEFTSEDAFRWFNSEGDGVSGLVIDVFGDIAVLQFFSKGCFVLRNQIQEWVQEIFPRIQRFHIIADTHVQKQESFDYRSRDAAPTTTIRENGLKFLIDPNVEHKTGFFLDQRTNRKMFANYAKAKNVLDLCCFSGGFALSAARTAQSVVAVDRSPEAIALARKNFELNSLEGELVVADATEYCHSQRGKRKFGLIMVDPAKMTRNREGVQDALEAYTRLNTAALELAEDGAIFVSCSCSGQVKEEDFIRALARAATRAGVTLSIFALTGASPDHPFAAQSPEGRYLKAVWAKVTNTKRNYSASSVNVPH